MLILKYSLSDIVELFDLLLEEMDYERDDLINCKMYFESDGYTRAIDQIISFIIHFF